MAIVSFYQTLNIPAGTARSAPASATLRVAPGRIVFLRLYVPPGPRGEISIWLEHNSRQIAPVPPATWDGLDDVDLETPLDYNVAVGEQAVALKGISPSANFAHRVDFEVLVDTSAAPLAVASQQSLIDRVAGLFGR